MEDCLEYRRAMISASSGWLVPIRGMRKPRDVRKPCSETASLTGEDFYSVTSEHWERAKQSFFPLHLLPSFM